MNTFLKTLTVLFVALQISACGQNGVFSTSPKPSTKNTASSTANFGTGQPEAKLTMISYNLKGIPAIFSSDVYTENNTNRATAFASYLKNRIEQGSAPDVVLLQEVFDPAVLTILTTHSNYPYHYTDYSDNYSLTNLMSGEIKLIPSGLLILSKHPITESAVHHFPGNLCAIEDCYAKKGVLWVKIQKPDLPFPIDIFNTHIQAGSAQEAVREKQINEMEKFVTPRADNARMMFFGGDFNFRINERYQSDDLFIRLFKLTDTFTSCLQLPDCKNDFQATRVKDVFGLLDHIFYKANPNNTEIKILQARSSDEKFNLNGQLTDLSDHPMVEFSYLLRWK